MKKKMLIFNLLLIVLLNSGCQSKEVIDTANSTEIPEKVETEKSEEKTAEAEVKDEKDLVLIDGELVYHEDNKPTNYISLEDVELVETVRVSYDATDFDGTHPFGIINDNQPYFNDDDKKNTQPFEEYSDLDSLGRCGVAYANICKELMPTEERGEIGHIKPSGWHTVKYEDIIEDRYLYNRCHLIGFQLAGENDNEKNLITGTRYLNIDGMLPFENLIADYVKETDNHVLYRVTPIYKDDNLVCEGVHLEGYSVEDKGKGICFNVFCFNVQPGIDINYSTGDSRRTD